MELNKFFKKLEDLGFINEEGNIRVSLKIVKDWPSNLDTENFEIDMVSNGDDKDGEGYIAGWAGGDWQEAARFTIMIPSTNEKPHTVMFDDPGTCFSGSDIHKELKKLYKEYKGNSNLTESIFNKILYESATLTDKEFIELYKKRKVTKAEKAKMDEYINRDPSTIVCGTTWKYSCTYFYKKVGNGYYRISFDDYDKVGEYNPNQWGKKLLRNGEINEYGYHLSIHPVYLGKDRYNDPNTGMNGTLWS